MLRLAAALAIVVTASVGHAPPVSAFSPLKELIERVVPASPQPPPKPQAERKLPLPPPPAANPCGSIPNACKIVILQ
jgi:hypothetical protein